MQTFDRHDGRVEVQGRSQDGQRFRLRVRLVRHRAPARLMRSLLVPLPLLVFIIQLFQSSDSFELMALPTRDVLAPRLAAPLPFRRQPPAHPPTELASPHRRCPRISSELMRRHMTLLKSCAFRKALQASSEEEEEYVFVTGKGSVRRRTSARMRGERHWWKE